MRLELVQAVHEDGARLLLGASEVRDRASVGRDRDRHALAIFESLAGWKVELETYCGQLRRSRQLRPGPSRGQCEHQRRATRDSERQSRAGSARRRGDSDRPTLSLQRVRELARRGEPIGRQLLERVRTAASTCAGTARRTAVSRRGSSVITFAMIACAVLAVCGGSPVEHLVRHRAERIDVGAPVDHAVARRLLGTHVLRRAERQSGLRDARAAGIARPRARCRSRRPPAGPSAAECSPA